MKIYIQPNIERTVTKVVFSRNGAVTERDPTFASLRALYPDPEYLLRLDAYAFIEELPVYGDIRIDGRDLFGTWSGNLDAPGHPVGLVTFALGLGWLLEDTIRLGEARFDPSEGGTVLKTRLDGSILTIHSREVEETFTVELSDAWNAIYGLHGRVRAFLLSYDRRFIEHPELGPWVRGDQLIVDGF